MPAKTLMLQGTSSHVGKSLLTAGICRLLARNGHSVAPFKAQNMSLNAAVTASGAEIGRAQALQALAAGIEAHADMNPILLKPEGDSRSQVVVLGKPWQSLSALDYETRKEALGPIIRESLTRLRQQFEYVIIEGAGSPVELNLKLRDIANMFVAEMADAPVLLIADIDRGGIFASLLGTLDLLQAHERRRVKGLIVNKFRGDLALFKDGIADLERRASAPVLGVIPYLKLQLPEEDSLGIAPVAAENLLPTSTPLVAVVKLPRLANFDDFLPLQYDSRLRVEFVEHPAALSGAAAVIIPGSKATIADLRWLRASGMAAAIQAMAVAGQPIIGICGGCQMLGKRIVDGVESEIPETEGLGLLPLQTRFKKNKRTVRVAFAGTTGWLAGATGQGYEIHAGQVEAAAAVTTTLNITAHDQKSYPEGWQQNNVWGSLVHGLFDNDAVRDAFVTRLAGSSGAQAAPSYRQALQTDLDKLADAIGHAIGLKRLLKLCR